MRQRRFLAFDLGASSGRALLGHLHDEKLHIRELHRFPNGMTAVHGHLHWNLFNLFEHIKEGLRLCAKEPSSQPQSLGIDTWGVDFGLLASDGAILGLPYGYRDRRTKGAMESFFAKVPRQRVYELTGIQFLELNSLFQLEAMVRGRSPLLRIASDLLFMPDLFHYLLTGVKKTEFTFATTSQLYNPRKRDWEDELLRALGLPKTLMQEVVMPGEMIGEISDEVADETGIGKVPVVAVATHDTGSAVAAVPAEGHDWAYISSGTWSLMGVETSNPIISKQSLKLNFTNEGGVEGTFRFLKNIAGLWLLEECRRAWSRERIYSYEELMNASSSAKPFKTFIDLDSQEFLNPPDMPEAISTYCGQTGQAKPDSAAEFVRCILESLALKYRFVLDQLRQVHHHPINRIYVIGGGAQNRTLCQFTANATGLPVIAGPAEATAIGNLMAQALSAGCVDSLADMRDVIRRSFELAMYEPQEEKDWGKAYEQFKDVAQA